MSHFPYSAPLPPLEPGPRGYSYITAIFLSPVSPNLWRDVGHHWRGMGLLYMLLLLALTWPLVAIRPYRAFRHFTANEAPKFIDQVPTITIHNGAVSVDQPEPCFITDPDNGQVIAVIDTTGQVTELPANASALLTRNKLMTQKSPNEQRIYDLAGVKDFYVDKDILHHWMRPLRTWLFPALAPFVLFGSLAWRLILMLILGALGLGFASAFRTPLSYAASLRLSAIAMTPGILLGTFLSLANVPLGCYHAPLGIALALIYMALAVRANRPIAAPVASFER